jgi:hypothetical protein
VYITNATQAVLGGTKKIWLEKEFLLNLRSLVCVYMYIYI